MNTTNAQPWTRPEQIDAMANMSTDLDDLGNLFEFGDIDLNLQDMPPVESAQYNGHMRAPGTHPSTPYDELNEQQAMASTAAQDFGGVHAQYIPQNMEQHQHHQQRAFNGQPQTSHPYRTEPMYPIMSNQQDFQFQNMQNYGATQHVIPPTPNSFEMHGETARFMQQQMDPQQRAILEQRYQLRKEDAMAFTPMASPAGTPQFSVQPEYTTIPGAYFSPLTSPMLHAQQNGQSAQQHQHSHPGYYGNASTAPSSNATSPLDPNADVDMIGDEMQLPDSATSQNKKPARRKPAGSRSAGPLAKVKQSPIQKATKRKSGTMLSSLATTRELESVSQPPRSASSQPRSAGLQMPHTHSSEDGSISPEPLSESIMGPPPRPGSSLGRSPMIAGQSADVSAGAPGKAATPKSLLQSKGSGQTPKTGPNSSEHKPSNGTDDQMEFEDLQLPAAAAPDGNARPSLPQINTRISETSSDGTPRLSARKTPKLGPSSTPSTARPTSAVASPSLAGSPMTASTPGALLKDKKLDVKGARSSKKRGSVSGTGSTLASPALRPRISPSIKPLLPEGASLQSPTHALLLASKSNYQNLLEGNQLPGVHYPESLSTGLTSKRTSHKVAEQGRRNRINEALKEMQSLLPKTATAKGAKENSNSDGSPEAPETKESKEEAAVKSNSSKAATVESANEYIRKMQKENEELLKKLRDAEDKARILETRGNGNGSSEGSGSVAGSMGSPAAVSS